MMNLEEPLVKMRVAGKLAADMLRFIEPYIVPGVTTNELNDLCHQYHWDNDAIPAPLGYKNYPKSICTSINHVVCHGIPSDRKLSDGDIINIDVTPIVDEYHGDTSKTFIVGKQTVKAKRLVQATYDAMMIGIEQIKPGANVNDIGVAIQEFVDGRFGIVEGYCGHGLNTVFHTEPQVPHFDTGMELCVLEPGMFLTVEPMLNLGKKETKELSDGWTVVTRDRSLSAQFEHTVYVSETGFEILTL